MKGEVSFAPEWVPVPPFDKHVAESKWQYCNCRSCQEHRHLLETLPGAKIDFNSFRLPGERY
jgi:hypothetical protein